MFKFEQWNSAFTSYLNKNFPLFSHKRKTKGYMTTSSMNFSAIIRFLCKKGAKLYYSPLFLFIPLPHEPKEMYGTKYHASREQQVDFKLYLRASRCRVPFSEICAPSIPQDLV